MASPTIPASASASDSVDGADHSNALDTVGCVARHDGAGESEPRRLGQPTARVADLAQLATEADLTEHGQVGGHRLAGEGADDGHAHREVEPGLDEPHATDRRHVDVGVADRLARPLLQDRQQQRQPPAVDALRCASHGNVVRCGRGERLHLDDDRALALHRRGDG